jgi:hypothetical protein
MVNNPIRGKLALLGVNEKGDIMRRTNGKQPKKQG